MITIKKVIIAIVFVFFNFCASIAQDVGSQIRLASNAELIVIGDSVSSSTDTFNTPLTTSHTVAVYQSVVFRVDRVLKGSYSEKFIRTMISYSIEYTTPPFPELLEVKNERKYILLLKYKLKPEQCKKLPDEEFNEMTCYSIINSAVIVAEEAEIETIIRLVNMEKAYNSNKKKMPQPKKKITQISKGIEKSSDRIKKQ